MIVCRKPNEKELLVLSNYYDFQKKTLTKKEAEKLLKVGEYNTKEYADKQSLAAMMQVISTIYNLEETFSKT